MEYGDVRRIVNQILGEKIAYKPCPVCKGDTTMIVGSFSPSETELEGEEYLRCVKCNTLFKEELREV